MSERHLRRIEVLSDVRTGRRTVAAAAAVLAVSERQAYRLLARCEVDGGSGLIHKARGRTSKPEYERRHPEVCGRANPDQVRRLRADPRDRSVAGQASVGHRQGDAQALADGRGFVAFAHLAQDLPPAAA